MIDSRSVERPALAQTWLVEVKTIHLDQIQVMAMFWVACIRQPGGGGHLRWVLRGLNSSPTWIQLTLGYEESLWGKGCSARCRGLGNVVFCIKTGRRPCRMHSRWRENIWPSSYFRGKKRKGAIWLEKAASEEAGRLRYMQLSQFCSSLWQCFLKL